MNAIQPELALHTDAQTIRDVLQQALPETYHDDIPRNTIRKANVLSVDGLNDFLLRTSALNSPDSLAQMHEVLSSKNTYLTTQEPFFSGPKVSQSLLTLCDDSATAYTLDKTPLGSFVPVHQKQTLSEYLYNTSKAQLQEKSDPLEVTDAKRKALIEHLLERPEALEELFTQAAYIGMQPRARNWPDLNEGNIMVNDDLSLSFIDVVSPEDLETEEAREAMVAEHTLLFSNAKGEDANKNIAEQYIHGEPSSLSTTLALHLIGEDDLYTSKLDPELRTRFSTLLQETIDKTIEKIHKGDIGKPEWKGFVNGADVSEEIAEDVNRKAGTNVFEKVNGVQAISLDAPAFTLKLALDALYAKAVPEQGAER